LSDAALADDGVLTDGVMLEYLELEIDDSMKWNEREKKKEDERFLSLF